MAIDLKKIESEFIQKVETFAKEQGIQMTTVFQRAGYRNHSHVLRFLYGNGGIGIKTMIKVESYIKSFKKD